MYMNSRRLFYGWIVLGAAAFVVFGVTGTQFSFGVFLKPMLEEYGWSRVTLGSALGISFMLAGLLRPVAGYLADRYSPKLIALLGVILTGITLFIIPSISNVLQLYIIFAIVSIGATLSGGQTLTKIVTSWFHKKRGLALGILNGGGSVGALVLVPAASFVIVVYSWQVSYQLIATLLLAVILPLGYILIRNRPEDIGVEAFGQLSVSDKNDDASSMESDPLFNATAYEATRTSFFWHLTIGYFV